MHMIVEFTREPALRFLSHLDLQRAVQRALRRSGLPIGYSQGFNPHIRLSFASALPVGMVSRGEIMEIKLQSPCAAPEFIQRFNQALPPGLQALDGVFLPEKAPAPMGLTYAARYQIDLPPHARPQLDAFLQTESFPAAVRTKSGEKQQDIRPLALALDWQGETLHATLSHREGYTLRPETLLGALGLTAQSVCRTGLLALRKGSLIPLLAYYRELGSQAPVGGAIEASPK